MDLTYLAVVLVAFPAAISVYAYVMYARRVRTEWAMRLAVASSLGFALSAFTVAWRGLGTLPAGFDFLLQIATYAVHFFVAVALVKVLRHASSSLNRLGQPSEQALQPDASASAHNAEE